MAGNGSFKEFEKAMTLLLICSAVDFIFFLVNSAMSITWMQVITGIVAIGLPLFCLVQLYLTKELLKQRSLWLTTGFGGIALCTLVSIIANFP